MKYIDLGLHSGNLWCDCNYGTNVPTENGKYFSFEAVQGLMGNKEELIPTKDDFQELIDYCKWEWVGNGYKVIGSNGNSIILPAAGCCDSEGFHFIKEVGLYWSSTPYKNIAQCAFGLYLSNGGCNASWTLSRTHHTVRRIKKQNKMKEEVRIEVPKGYMIDKENSTFECIKFKKKEVLIYTCSLYEGCCGVVVETPDTSFMIIDTYEVLANWENAKKHCKMISQKAELPSEEQLKIIHKYFNEINALLFNTIERSWYWSNKKHYSSSSWVVNVTSGYSYTNYRGSALRVRPIINL